MPLQLVQCGISSLNMISKSNSVKQKLCLKCLPFTNSKSYSFRQSKQCAVKNVPCASTSFSAGIPATRSNESIFYRNKY
jgi:hypothetical protein